MQANPRKSRPQAVIRQDSFSIAPGWQIIPFTAAPLQPSRASEDAEHSTGRPHGHSPPSRAHTRYQAAARHGTGNLSKTRPERREDATFPCVRGRKIAPMRGRLFPISAPTPGRRREIPPVYEALSMIGQFFCVAAFSGRCRLCGFRKQPRRGRVSEPASIFATTDDNLRCGIVHRMQSKQKKYTFCSLPHPGRRESLFLNHARELRQMTARGARPGRNRRARKQPPPLPRTTHGAAARASRRLPQDAGLL